MSGKPALIRITESGGILQGRIEEGFLALEKRANPGSASSARAR
ncbi:hypothetical protein ACRAWD_27790 [Caulobacter segnis]